MASLIDINTEELQQYVQLARQANEALTGAASLLNSVVEHNDWQCPEREAINQNTTRNRTDSMRLQQDAENFYKAVVLASEDFLAAENEVNQSINSVDEMISRFLSLVPSETASDDSNWSGPPMEGGPAPGVYYFSGSQTEKSSGFGNMVSFQDIKSSLAADGGISLFKKK